MDRYIRYIIFLVGVVCYFNSCVEDPDLSGDVKNAMPPTVELLTGVEDGYDVEKSATTIKIQAEVVSANGFPVEGYGICWSLKENPTIEESDTTVCGKGLGIYEAMAKGLEADTVYYLRPFAVNKKGVSYGDVFTTSTNTGIGSIRTLKPWNIKATSVTCGGKMIEWGEGDIEKRGVYLYKSSLKDPKPQFIPMEMEAERDSFYQSVLGLDPSTVYYVAAYVENTFGVFPGGETIKFETTDGKPYISTFELSKKDYTSATFRTILRTTGDAPITEFGYCYSETDTLPELGKEGVIPVQSTKFENDSVFMGKLSGLEQQKIYYVRSYVANSFGISYSEGEAYRLIVQSNAPTVTTSVIAGSDIKDGTIAVKGEIKDKGESDIEKAGFCWSTKQNPTIMDDTISVYHAGDSLLSGVITGLKGGMTYYIRAYATNKSAATSYGETRIVETPDIISSLTLYSGESVTEASACVLNGMGYVFGGDLGGERSAELMAYDIQADEWIERSPANIAVKGAAFFPLNTLSILSLGGKDNKNNVTNTFSVYQVRDNEWKSDILNSTLSLYDASGITLNNVIYFIGGSAQDTISNKIYRCTIESEILSCKEAGEFPEKQFGSLVTEINGMVYAGLGTTGTGLSGTSYSKRLWVSTDMNTWKELAKCPTEASNILCGTACLDRLYVLDYNLDIWVFNPASGTWIKQNTSLKSTLSVIGLNNIFMFSYGSSLYIGMTNGNKTFIKYSPLWDN